MSAPTQEQLADSWCPHCGRVAGHAPTCAYRRPTLPPPALPDYHASPELLAIATLANSGIDTTCGSCMEVAFTGSTMHEHTCKEAEHRENLNRNILEMQREIVEQAALLVKLWPFARHGDRCDAGKFDRGEFPYNWLSARPACSCGLDALKRKEEPSITEIVPALDL